MIGSYCMVENQQAAQLLAGELRAGELEELGKAGTDIDKAWQAIHYLLCGEIDNGQPPLGYVVPLQDDFAVEYGDFGAFVLSSENVKAALAAMQPLDHEGLLERYDLEGMLRDGVYPVIADEDAAEFFEYIEDCFFQIKAFYETAARAGKGVLFYID